MASYYLTKLLRSWICTCEQVGEVFCLFTVRVASFNFQGSPTAPKFDTMDIQRMEPIMKHLWQTRVLWAHVMNASHAMDSHTLSNQQQWFFVLRKLRWLWRLMHSRSRATKCDEITWWSYMTATFRVRGRRRSDVERVRSVAIFTWRCNWWVVIVLRSSTFPRAGKGNSSSKCSSFVLMTVDVDQLAESTQAHCWSALMARGQEISMVGKPSHWNEV